MTWRFEVTPFLGFRFGGHFDVEGSDRNAHVNAHPDFAIAAGIRVDESQGYELFYSRQSTSLGSAFGHASVDVSYLHVSGSLSSENPYPLNPYLTGSLGVTQLSLDAPGAGDRSRFSISLGGGLRLPVRPRFDVRVEARVYLTFLNTASSVFCGSGQTGGGCAIRGSGSLFAQYGLLAGAAFAF